MNHMTQHDHQQMAAPQMGHNMSDIRASHDRHAGHSVAMFRDKFWLSLALTIPVVFWSTDVQHWLGYTAPTFPGSKFIPPILGTVVFVYGGLVFIRGAWGELADHKPGHHFFQLKVRPTHFPAHIWRPRFQGFWLSGVR
jgi:Cu2+-exporting ATPase